MADQEHVGRDIAGVRVKVRDRRLVGERADPKQDPVRGQKPKADLRCAAGPHHGRHSISWAQAGEDRLAELSGPGELRPVAGRQIDVIDVADFRELLHVIMSLLDQLTNHRARELAGDDSDGHVVAALVGEPLRVPRDMYGRRDGTLPEPRAQLVIEVKEVLLVKERPIRQRNIAVLSRKRVIDHVALAEGNAVDVHDPGYTVRPCIDSGMGYRATSGVSDEYNLRIRRIEGVDHCDNRLDMVAQCDLGSVRLSRLHTGQCERISVMSCLPEGGHDLVPRRAVEPQTGNQNDVHPPEAKPSPTYTETRVCAAGATPRLLPVGARPQVADPPYRNPGSCQPFNQIGGSARSAKLIKLRSDLPGAFSIRRVG